jgi:hypothetical protein
MLTKESVARIKADLAKRTVLQKQLKEYTAKAIAKRHGCHWRTVENISAKETHNEKTKGEL